MDVVEQMLSHICSCIQYFLLRLSFRLALLNVVSVSRI